ncbi:MAG: hypothetical protein HY866_01585 [Chloroflexi bacterium]|nr:hypothetical protein [Chloroflexota bacterium]
MRYQYPLKMSFKIVAVAPQIYVRDAQGTDLFYVKQKLLKLKEDIGVFSDSSKSRQLFTIKADRIIDFSAKYHFTSSTDNRPLGAVKREGMKSLWRASYQISNPAEQPLHTIREGNPWAKVGDGCMSSLPMLGLLSGYFFHPSYIVYQTGTETPLMKLEKQPAFFEGVFKIEALAPNLSDEDETRFLLSFIMMILLERQRG